MFKFLTSLIYRKKDMVLDCIHCGQTNMITLSFPKGLDDPVLVFSGWKAHDFMTDKQWNEILNLKPILKLAKDSPNGQDGTSVPPGALRKRHPTDSD